MRLLLLALLSACGDDTVIAVDSGTDAHALDATTQDVDAAPPLEAGDVDAGPGIAGAAAYWIEVDDTNLYWVGTYQQTFGPLRIWSAPKAGGAPTVVFDPVADGGSGQVYALAQDATDLFFFVTHGTQTGSAITVNRVAKTGGASSVLAQFTLLPFAIDLATDGVDLFWLTDDGIVHRTPVGGGTTTSIFSGAFVSLSGRQLALDTSSHRIYVPTTSGISAIDTVSEVATAITTPLAGLQLAPFPGGAIFIDGTASAFARIDGTQYSALGIDAHLAVQALASDGKTIYWFHDGVGAPDLTDGALSSAPAIDGGTETVMKGGLESLENYGNAMTMDDASVYFSAVVVPDGGINGEPHLYIVPR